MSAGCARFRGLLTVFQADMRYAAGLASMVNCATNCVSLVASSCIWDMSYFLTAVTLRSGNLPMHVALHMIYQVAFTCVYKT